MKSESLSNVTPRVVLGVSAGIAAYKACTIASHLTSMGTEVRVVMTPDSQKFVTPLTFRALTNQPVYTDMFEAGWELSHISLAEWADLFLVAPATADIIARFASGFADNLLAATFLAFKGLKAVAPAMNTGMWDSPATRRNLEVLRDDGVYIFEPDSGRLACGSSGAGRLPDPEFLTEAAYAMALSHSASKKPLKGKKAIVTAGPTREYLDPIRFLANPSTGTAGIEVARSLRNAGADVTLILGPVDLTVPFGITVEKTVSAQDMYEAVMRHAEGCDIAVCSAAVADFTPSGPAEEKMKKEGKDDLNLTLKRTPDILLSIRKLIGEAVIVGYAAETENLAENASNKMKRKGCDILVANLAGRGRGFGNVSPEGFIIRSDGVKEELHDLNKNQTAERLIDHITEMFRKEKINVL